MEGIRSAWDVLETARGARLPAVTQKPAALGVGYVTAGTPSALDAMLRGTSLGSDEMALSVSAVHRSTSLISGAVASMPLAIKRKVGAAREDASDHWAQQLMARPNGWQTPSQFKRLMQTHMLLRGNGFALKVASGGRVSELRPLSPDRVKVEQLNDWSVEYVYTRKDGGQLRIPQREMFHLCGLSLDGVVGLSVLGLARATIGQALSIQRHGTSVFDNATRIGGVLTHPKTLSQESVQRLRDGMEQFRGAENAGKSLVLEEGMTFAQMAMTLEDAQFVQNAALTRQEIYQFFGLPPHMAGDTEKATSWGSGIEAMSLGFVTYTLNDWLVIWEETIARDLLFGEPTLFARFNRDSLTRGDIGTRFARYAIERQWGLRTINEIRAKEDENPIEGGNDLFAGGNGQRAGLDAEPAPKGAANG